MAATTALRPRRTTTWGSGRGNSHDMKRESFESTRSCFDLPLRSHPSIHLTDLLLYRRGGLIYNDVRGRRIVIRHKVHRSKSKWKMESWFQLCAARSNYRGPQIRSVRVAGDYGFCAFDRGNAFDFFPIASLAASPALLLDCSFFAAAPFECNSMKIYRSIKLD